MIYIYIQLLLYTSITKRIRTYIYGIISWSWFNNKKCISFHSFSFPIHFKNNVTICISLFLICLLHEKTIKSGCLILYFRIYSKLHLHTPSYPMLSGKDSTLLHRRRDDYMLTGREWRMFPDFSFFFSFHFP